MTGWTPYDIAVEVGAILSLGLFLTCVAVFAAIAAGA
jgi:hypothetical protein